MGTPRAKKSNSWIRNWWWPLSIKTPVFGIDRGRVSFLAELTCKRRRLKMFWVQKIIIFNFCVFKVLQCTSGRSAKYLTSLYTCAQSRQSLHSACEGIYCKYFKRVCETILMFGVPVQKVRDLQRLLRCLFSFENVNH